MPIICLVCQKNRQTWSMKQLGSLLVFFFVWKLKRGKGCLGLYQILFLPVYPVIPTVSVSPLSDLYFSSYTKASNLVQGHQFREPALRAKILLNEIKLSGL